MSGSALMQIGEVADRTGLSLRTIRYYEEVGIVVPSARSQGGFRLYAEPDVDRLMVIRRMKPLDFTLEQMRELLDIVDRLADGSRIPPAERRRMLGVLEEYRAIVKERQRSLRAKLAYAEEFDGTLRARMEALGG